MRILHVASGDLWAGAEVQLYTLLRSLRAFPDTEVRAALLNDGELAARLRADGIAVDVFPEAQLGAARILTGMRRVMAGWKPDIVHTHRIKENILGSMANRLTGKVPCVRTVHGAAEHARGGLLRLHKRLFQYADHWCGLRLQDAVIAVSAELAVRLAGSFPAAKVRTITNGVDIGTARAQASLADFRAREPAACHIGLVGRLVAVKRPDLFLATAGALRDRDPARHWRFHIIGDGPLRATTAELANSLSLAGCVTFHGHRADIVSCISSLDALLLTSDHEGLPMVALEALAVGTPVIAHAVGGLVELLREAPPCALVPEHTPGSYTDAVLAALEQSGARDPARFDRTLSGYSARTNAERTLQLYRELRDAN